MSTVFSLFTKPRNLSIIYNVLKRQHTTKSVLGETIIQLDHTLLGRIMSYLNMKENNLQNKVSVDAGISVINNLVHGKGAALRSLNVDQLAGLFYSANTNPISHSKQEMMKALELLDVECCLRINSMDSASILKVLNAYMHVIPNRITEYKFYQYATDSFDRRLNEANQKDLLQFIFYIGLQKHSKRPQMLLKKCLRNIDKNMLQNLTVEDLCIICNSTYRTHMKITNKRILDKIKDTLNNNLYLLKDPSLLITLVKTIKHNACQDDDILSTIKCTIFFNKTSQYYSFAAMCHILSLYTDDLYYDEDLLKLFMDKCINDLQSSTIKPKGTYLDEQVRVKDITRFLWVLSRFGFNNIDEDAFEKVIIPNIQKRIRAGMYNNHPEELTDTILYLRMLNYPAKELIKQALTPEHMSYIGNTQSKKRLNLLLTMIKYEDEELFKYLNIKRLDLSTYHQNPQLELRYELQRVFRVLNTICNDLDITSFKMDTQIPHVNIIGISAYKEKQKVVVNIEVLDDTNCVKNKDCSPTGYMKLKLRILEQLAVPLITIPQSDIKTLTEEELQTYLKEEFQLIVY